MGGACTGKRTICRTLANYSVKVGSNVIYANLDPNFNEIAPLGTIAATYLSTYMGYEPNEIEKLGYFFGSEELSADNLEQYSGLVRSMMGAIERRMDSDRQAYLQENTLKKNEFQKEDLVLKYKKSLFASGCIVNAPAFFADAPQLIVKHFVSLVKPTHILVIDHDGLKTTLANEFPNCKVLKLPKSGGVIQV